MNDRDPVITASLDQLAAAAAQKRPDWEDVLARARGPRRRAAVAAALALAAALVLLTSALAIDRDLWRGLVGTPVDKTELARKNREALLRSVGATGKEVDLHREGRERRAAQLNALLDDYGEIKRIADRKGTSFYILEPKTPAGSRCFAVAQDENPQPFGTIVCPRKEQADAFPSPRYPILDVSSIGANVQNPSMRVIRLEGFAADAVKSVGIQIGDEIEAETPVVDNVYIRTSGLPETTGEIVALDENGDMIGCAPQATPTSNCR